MWRRRPTGNESTWPPTATAIAAGTIDFKFLPIERKGVSEELARIAHQKK
jgi:hypothetical protein